MKIGNLRKATRFLKSFFFMENVCKMRNTLISYLAEEGIRAEVYEGNIVFIYNGYHYFVDFQVNDGYAECLIEYYSDEEDFASLDLDNKTFIADKVNTDMDSHVHMMAYSDSFFIKTSFYFTSKRMLLELFRQHFMEMTACLGETNELLQVKADERKHKFTKIGFYSHGDEKQDEQQKSGETQVAATAE